MAGMMNLSLVKFPLPENDFRRLKMCINEPNTTVGQEVRVVVAYIDARPARMHEPFIALALESLQKAWPCK